MEVGSSVFDFGEGVYNQLTTDSGKATSGIAKGARAAASRVSRPAVSPWQGRAVAGGGAVGDFVAGVVAGGNGRTE